MSETKQQPYFPHNANSRNDDNLIRLRMHHGVAGYGVYYMLLERLRLAEGYQCALDYEILSWDLDCGQELIRSVIYDFGLFVIVEDGQMFQSVELNAYMKLMEDKKAERAARAKAAADARWGKSVANIPVDTPQETPQVAKKEESSKETVVKEDRLERELEIMKADEEWLGVLSESTGKTKAELIESFPKFKQRCILNNIKNGHKDMQDAYKHFESWLYKSGLLKTKTDENRPRSSKKTESEIRQQKDAEINARNEEYQRRETNSRKPEEWVRNQGYDPQEVTLLQLMSPGWREQNPPTHPEWIGKDITEPVEVEAI
ncbi:MAG: DUF4373 domain-containing protein [Muribaculaceae bacterium]|nr:DUF4373 domain-containing protein [Muribaculaceae bacterium]